MNLNIKEKVIIVTQCDTSLGQAIAGQLALEVAFPVLIGNDSNALASALELINAAGGFGHIQLADLVSSNNCLSAINEVYKRFGRINGLINIGTQSQTFDIPNKNETEFSAVIQMTEDVQSYLIESKGFILNVVIPDTKTNLYNLGTEERNPVWIKKCLERKIKINTIVYESENSEKMLSNENQELIHQEMANAVAFLCSNRSKSTTGQLIQLGGN